MEKRSTRMPSLRDPEMTELVHRDQHADRHDERCDVDDELQRAIGRNHA
jgi:hypothetical protein